MKRRVLIMSVVAMLISLFGCGSSGTVRQATRYEPVVPKTGQTKPIMFKKIVSVVPRGKVIGTMQAGTFCSSKGPLCWKNDKTNISDAELGDLLRDQLQKYRYTVVGDPEALFEDRSAEKAEFLIAGKIKDVKASMCFPRSGSEDWVTAKGELYVQVDWELYSKKTRDVVLKLTTEGSSTSNGKAQSYQEIFYQAFDMAVGNMLAHNTFYQQVALDSEAPVQKKAEQAMADIKVNFKTVADLSKKENLSREKLIGNMRSSVVTVFSGSGHGSGFLISEDGYVLTNEHVVGGASFVNVKFVTGKEVTGQVVRVDKPRDVALIKLEKDFYPYLVLGNTNSINIGEEVFTIGTPLSEDLSQTVTKGIVSSFRVKDEIKYVQSDVNIHPGNSGGPLVSLNKGVIGVCVSGITFGPYTLGLNYFVPIEEAIKALKISKDVT
ncbi:MAG: putative periplasmic serine endoprotease DegP-like precursor [Syntrophorhabdaceae bacterium PtaU1.Bin034]|nr:MAG: putative periplasmic serine endoprotease DegP-like precursor [Syntrophorhabdaceae bacterium PtaU1.Bin034]